MRKSESLCKVLFLFCLFIVIGSCKKDPPKTLPTVSTSSISNITQTTATSGGTVSDDGNSPVTARGVCWSTNENPTVSDKKSTDGSGTGNFNSLITDLLPGTTYFLRAYGSNSIGISYGNQISFSTTATIPTVKTTEILEIAATNALIGVEILSNGGSEITSKGICWSINQTPTLEDSTSININNLNEFESFIGALLPSTVYFVRAYATNAIGTGYGNVLSFKSLSAETLNYALEGYPGYLGDLVSRTYDGIEIECERKSGLDFFQGDIVIQPITKASGTNNSKCLWPGGIVYYTIHENFPDKERIIQGMDLFSKTNITFKQRTNEENYIEFKYIKDAGCYSYVGMIGGKQLIVIDTWGKAGAVAHEIGHSIGLYHEHAKRDRDDYIEVKDDNIKWGKKHNFKIHKESIGTIGFDFNSLMLYSSYAWSKNGKPTIVYSETKLPFPDPQTNQFTESDIKLINIMYPAKPMVRTINISFVSSRTAIFNGEVLHDGGWNVYERGVCWSTNQSPSINDNKITSGSGVGNYSCSLAGLSPNTKYYARAYAINSSGLGAAYGNEISFITLAGGTSPVAAFTASSTSINLGQTIQFTDQSTGNPTSWSWDFGDGGTSTIQNPSYTYTKSGSYNVSLEVNNSTGSNSISKTNYVTVLTTSGSLSDSDGNTYTSIKIGNQTWMVENLKTTKLNDGTSISNLTEDKLWYFWNYTSIPGYCWYSNDITHKKPYGALYNWITVNSGKLCPTGWHVPSTEEWNTLIEFLGGSSDAFNKLIQKGTTYWENPNSSATNSSGFTALPAGFRDGIFSGLRTHASWWTSNSSNSSHYASTVSLYIYNQYVSTNNLIYKTTGRSVRCIKN